MVGGRRGGLSPSAEGATTQHGSPFSGNLQLASRYNCSDLVRFLHFSSPVTALPARQIIVSPKLTPTPSTVCRFLSKVAVRITTPWRAVILAILRPTLLTSKLRMDNPHHTDSKITDSKVMRDTLRHPKPVTLHMLVWLLQRVMDTIASHRISMAHLLRVSNRTNTRRHTIRRAHHLQISMALQRTTIIKDNTACPPRQQQDLDPPTIVE